MKLALKIILRLSDELFESWLQLLRLFLKDVPGLEIIWLHRDACRFVKMSSRKGWIVFLLGFTCLCSLIVESVQIVLIMCFSPVAQSLLRETNQGLRQGSQRNLVMHFIQ